MIVDWIDWNVTAQITTLFCTGFFHVPTHFLDWLMFVWVSDDSSILAFSAVSVSRWRACLSFNRSIPSSLLKSPASQSTILCVVKVEYHLYILRSQQKKIGEGGRKRFNKLTVTCIRHTLSKSSPPKCVSPEVDSTSNTPSPTSKTGKERRVSIECLYGDSSNDFFFFETVIS